jgi:serine/threonine protein kinase
MAALQKIMASSNFPSGAGEQLSQGDRVGGGCFLLKRLLGRGEISEVWLAQDMKNSRQVALKFLPPWVLAE